MTQCGYKCLSNVRGQINLGATTSGYTCMVNSIATFKMVSITEFSNIEAKGNEKSLGA